jgi:GT2 family glycosyltransferase
MTANPAPTTEAKAEMLVTVIIVNYNAYDWMKRCFESLAAQTIARQVQIILIDNISSDGSDKLAQELMTGLSNALFIQMGENAGFGRACNRAVQDATGKYLLLLNPDVWLERDCLEQLVNGAERSQSAAAGPLVLNYDDDSFQSNGNVGFDLCGMFICMAPDAMPEELFCANGFYFIRTDVYLKVGGEDEAFFLYTEEIDLSWRVWISGNRIVYAPKARIHHRGSISVNPKGGTKMVELRTSDSKRFFANRNHLLCLLKNCHHVLLLMLIPSLILLFVEGLVGSVLARRWSFFRKTCWDVLKGCWQLRGHVLAKRRQVRGFRQRGDFWMLRFFSFRLNRLGEMEKIFRLGPPKLDHR